MEPMSWSALFGAANAANTIIDDSKRNAIISKIKLLFRENRKIVIFGLSGAGKSQFISSLKKNLTISQSTDVTTRVDFDLNDFPIIFVDTPGQDGREFARKQEVTKILKDGVEGIINVISYGYEENAKYSFNAVFDDQKNVRSDFLEKARQVEIERLNEWLSWIQPNNTKWIINLVNKADIWWEQIDKVNHHYENAYGLPFASLSNFTNIITIPFCSIIKPYYGVRTSGLFGDLEKERLHNHFINQLGSFLNRD